MEGKSSSHCGVLTATSQRIEYSSKIEWNAMIGQPVKLLDLRVNSMEYSSTSILYWLTSQESQLQESYKHHWLPIKYMKCSHYIRLSYLFSWNWLLFQRNNTLPHRENNAKLVKIHKNISSDLHSHLYSTLNIISRFSRPFLKLEAKKMNSTQAP